MNKVKKVMVSYLYKPVLFLEASNSTQLNRTSVINLSLFTQWKSMWL